MLQERLITMEEDAAAARDAQAVAAAKLSRDTCVSATTSAATVTPASVMLWTKSVQMTALMPPWSAIWQPTRRNLPS